ncbi:ORF6N domain-containing protein [bacterium]|nr:ORF6N domain-containing protein [bacterium]MBU3955427.1 ORF6N domain-containing protein [bacterium]
MKNKNLIKTLPKTVAVSVEEIESRIIELNGQKVILDSDVAELYAVETKRINEAVKNNQDKFPCGYIAKLNRVEWNSLKSKFSTSIKGGKTKVPYAFTEKGLYMLATILKSSSATATAIAIIEAFAKLRKLTRNIKELSVTKDKNTQKSLMRESGGLATEIFADNLTSSESETSIELNFAVLKVKHTIKKTKK